MNGFLGALTMKARGVSAIRPKDESLYGRSVKQENPEVPPEEVVQTDVVETREIVDASPTKRSTVGTERRTRSERPKHETGSYEPDVGDWKPPSTVESKPAKRTLVSLEFSRNAERSSEPTPENARLSDSHQIADMQQQGDSVFLTFGAETENPQPGLVDEARATVPSEETTGPSQTEEMAAGSVDKKKAASEADSRSQIGDPLRLTEVAFPAVPRRRAIEGPDLQATITGKAQGHEANSSVQSRSLDQGDQLGPSSHENVDSSVRRSAEQDRALHLEAPSNSTADPESPRSNSRPMKSTRLSNESLELMLASAQRLGVNDVIGPVGPQRRAATGAPATSESTIQVSIGRIEIREQRREPPAPVVRRVVVPPIGLSEYLTRRFGGRNHE